MLSGIKSQVAGLADEALSSRSPHQKLVTVEPKRDPTRRMQALSWQGKNTVKVIDIPVPLVTEPRDAVIRVTSTGICGSDLHLYTGSFPGMLKNDIMGHEFMGIVEDVGPQVNNVKKGDRVVVAFNVVCGECIMCKKELYSHCQASNNSWTQEKMLGGCCGAFYGYSHTTGGYQGGQAEYVRVPFADNGLLKVPADLPDEKLVPLADALPTAWYATEMAEVGPGDNVAIWGAGPVGQLTAICAFNRGAARVMLIDDVKYRLEHAKANIPGVETMSFKDASVVDKLKEVFAPLGPDACIEQAGNHYVHSMVHKVETALALETDTSEIINELLKAARPGGRVAISGMYIGFTNHFNIGALMEKALTVRGGPTPLQRYWPMLLQKVVNGEIDPSVVVTHTLPLSEAEKGYHLFDKKLDNCVKIILKTPKSGQQPDGKIGGIPVSA